MFGGKVGFGKSAYNGLARRPKLGKPELRLEVRNFFLDFSATHEKSELEKFRTLEHFSSEKCCLAFVRRPVRRANDSERRVFELPKVLVGGVIFYYSYQLLRSRQEFVRGWGV